MAVWNIKKSTVYRSNITLKHETNSERIANWMWCYPIACHALAFCQVPLTVCWCQITLLGGEERCTLRANARHHMPHNPRQHTQHNTAHVIQRNATHVTQRNTTQAGLLDPDSNSPSPNNVFNIQCEIILVKKNCPKASWFKSIVYLWHSLGLAF